IMSSVRSRGNRATELVMLKLLRNHRVKGWRRHLPIIGRPDFAFPKERIAIFLDGCFWHGCPVHFKLPESNRDFWKKRIETNCQRYQRTTRLLRSRGWTVIRIWQHEITKSPARRIWRLQKMLDAKRQRSENLVRAAD